MEAASAVRLIVSVRLRPTLPRPTRHVVPTRHMRSYADTRHGSGLSIGSRIKVIAALWDLPATSHR
jgi:hypothetical protein